MTKLKVTDWAAKTGPLFPHSAIIEGDTDIGIVDVQQSKSEAHRLVADVLEKGKKLKWVYVTHPHLDHFAGANIVRDAFPDAKFYGPSATMNKEMAHQVATRRLALGEGIPGGEYNIPEVAPNYFEVVPPEGLTLNDEIVEVLVGKGDHPDSSIVWIPSAEVLIGGDVIFNQTHAFFGDHDDLPSWIALVEKAVQVKPLTIIAGHSKTLNPSGEIAEQQLAWLKDLDVVMKQFTNPDEVKQAMVSKYPDFANDFIFEFSYGVKQAREEK